ncbi:putative ABC transport system ATP-binding protein [Deinobacterium chartae]|uniref:Putative ABC transport system ATP-binding protein n=1 Tax=Deinobacterium chartae TaxID=521158 RepID=A0A841I3M5_9DEIO|nr:ATP-binding cassette domain-containing protein [Deinobacterium chartae]MBB6099913.1 putative ABC transport system ATP-binding protein [Deinobacterium chartae]
MLLSARDLTRAVARKTLWHGLGFDLAPGERLAITGPSGSGKSLLLRALAALDPLESGQVYLEGRVQSAWPMPLYRARVMYLPQRPALGQGRVLDELRLPFGLRVHAHRTWREAAALEILEQLGRPASFLELEGAHLSGGERQLVALARALLLSPSVLLLDEATAALDPQAVRCAEDALERWVRAESGRALVWVSHDPAQRERVADRELNVRLAGGSP